MDVVLESSNLLEHSTSSNEVPAEVSEDSSGEILSQLHLEDDSSVVLPMFQRKLWWVGDRSISVIIFSSYAHHCVSRVYPLYDPPRMCCCHFGVVVLVRGFVSLVMGV